jgi:hypothetical protein
MSEEVIRKETNAKSRDQLRHEYLKILLIWRTWQNLDHRIHRMTVRHHCQSIISKPLCTMYSSIPLDQRKYSSHDSGVVFDRDRYLTFIQSRPSGLNITHNCSTSWLNHKFSPERFYLNVLSVSQLFAHGSQIRRVAAQLKREKSTMTRFTRHFRSPFVCSRCVRETMDFQFTVQHTNACYFWCCSQYS